ncbi:hypothetical protein RCL_jg16292.t1 [Rhizophagus clarus]|uniref:Uncharacterized protein n=1 Tax=Rhizophagus clarus TaxID=94130 RepID=A0A8H3QZM3_9GLOM|nr:hypothetical protein RCL_jg16292.t1 [Rhizophagus clarus]
MPINFFYILSFDDESVTIMLILSLRDEDGARFENSFMEVGTNNIDSLLCGSGCVSRGSKNLRNHQFYYSIIFTESDKYVEKKGITSKDSSNVRPNLSNSFRYCQNSINLQSVRTVIIENLSQILS